MWLSLHYLREIMEKLSYNSRYDYAHSAEQLNTGWFFPHLQCQQFHTVRTVAGFPTKIRTGGGGKRWLYLAQNYSDYTAFRITGFRITGFRITGFRITKQLL